nr:hypothetical protein [Brevundimonas sp. AJA228-03]
MGIAYVVEGTTRQFHNLVRCPQCTRASLTQPFHQALAPGQTVGGTQHHLAVLQNELDFGVWQQTGLSPDIDGYRDLAL